MMRFHKNLKMYCNIACVDVCDLPGIQMMVGFQKIVEDYWCIDGKINKHFRQNNISLK